MSEVEKMYSNANIKICKRKQGFTLKDCTDRDCKECGYYDMPPFTAEKQIELIKWLSKRCFYIEISEMADKSYGIAFKYQPADEYKNEQSECCTNKVFAEALAESINYILQDLTEEERKQIKEMLE